VAFFLEFFFLVGGVGCLQSDTSLPFHNSCCGWPVDPVHLWGSLLILSKGNHWWFVWYEIDVVSRGQWKGTHSCRLGSSVTVWCITGVYSGFSLHMIEILDVLGCVSVRIKFGQWFSHRAKGPKLIYSVFFWVVGPSLFGRTERSYHLCPWIRKCAMQLRKGGHALLIRNAVPVRWLFRTLWRSWSRPSEKIVLPSGNLVGRNEMKWPA